MVHGGGTEPYPSLIAGELYHQMMTSSVRIRFSNVTICGRNLSVIHKMFGQRLMIMQSQRFFCFQTGH